MEKRKPSRKLIFAVIGLVILTGFGAGLLIIKCVDPIIWTALLTNIMLVFNVYCKFNNKDKELGYDK